MTFHFQPLLAKTPGPKNTDPNVWAHLPKQNNALIQMWRVKRPLDSAWSKAL